MKNMIKSYCPRLVLEDTLFRTDGKDKKQQDLASVDIIFGYLCFLEFGSFLFCECAEVKVLDESVCVFVNETWKTLNVLEDVEKIQKVTVIKLLGKDVWDTNFFLVLKVEGEEIMEIVDLKEANNIHINKLMVKGILEKYKKSKDEFNFQSKIDDDVYEIPHYKTIMDILKPKKKEKKIKPPVILEGKDKKTAAVNVITEEITTFTFLKGIKDIKLETTPPLKYKRLN